jgi:hypothetical protein
VISLFCPVISRACGPVRLNPPYALNPGKKEDLSGQIYCASLSSRGQGWIESQCSDFDGSFRQIED